MRRNYVRTQFSGLCNYFLFQGDPFWRRLGKGGSFSVILMFSCMVFCTSYSTAIRNCISVLKDSGLLICEDNAPSLFNTLLSPAFGCYCPHENQSERWFTRAGLENDNMGLIMHSDKTLKDALWVSVSSLRHHDKVWFAKSAKLLPSRNQGSF